MEFTIRAIVIMFSTVAGVSFVVGIAIGIHFGMKVKDYMLGHLIAIRERSDVLLDKLDKAADDLVTSNKDIIQRAYHNFHDDLKGLDEFAEKIYKTGRNDVIKGLERMANPNLDDES